MSKAKQPTTRAAMPAHAVAARPTLARDHFTDDLSSVTGLAQLIAALMNHPLIPVEMYNDLGDSIASLDMHRIDESPLTSKPCCVTTSPPMNAVRRSGEGKRATNNIHPSKA